MFKSICRIVFTVLAVCVLTIAGMEAFGQSIRQDLKVTWELPYQAPNGGTAGYWVYNNKYTEGLMDSFYFNLVTMGADGLINFRMEIASKEVSIGNSQSTMVYGTKISGFAIRRK